jgi:hypothetical protein
MEELKQLRMSHEADLKRSGRARKVVTAQKEKLQSQYEGEHESTTRRLAQANDQVRDLSR